MKTQVLSFILVLATRLPAYICEPDYYIAFSWVDGFPGDKVTETDFSEMRVRGYGLFGAFLNGTYTFKRDFNNNDTCQFEVTRASIRDYYGRPLYLSDKIPAANFFNKYYTKYAEPMFAGKTNFTSIPPEGIDHVPKGTYYIVGAKAEDMKSVLPNHLDFGYGFYRIITYFRDQNGESIGALKLVFEAQLKQNY